MWDRAAARSFDAASSVLTSVGRGERIGFQVLEKDSFQLVDELFDAVLDLDPEDRAAYLDAHSPSVEIREPGSRVLESPSLPFR